jgi:hypothetical protein
MIFSVRDFFEGERAMRWRQLLLGLLVCCCIWSAASTATAGHRWRGSYGAGFYAGGFNGLRQGNIWNYGSGFTPSPGPGYVFSGAYGAAVVPSPGGTYSNPQPSVTVIEPFRRW